MIEDLFLRGVSHERLRGIVKAESPPNLTIATYRKILNWLNSTQGSKGGKA
jgi:hypothetical protein